MVIAKEQQLINYDNSVCCYNHAPCSYNHAPGSEFKWDIDTFEGRTCYDDLNIGSLCIVVQV